jgi:hypothetical protein
VFLVFNGAETENVPLAPDRKSATLSKTVKADRSGWFHLRAEGRPEERYPLDAGYAQAFTNPVWVTVSGRPPRDRASAEYALRWIDKLQQMAEAWPHWRSEKEKAHVFLQFDEARAIRDIRIAGDTLGLDACARGAVAKTRTRTAPDVGTASVVMVVKFQPL